jgi:hypothetical protein
VVTGTPILTTTATSSANAGTFPIRGKNGSLTAQNYDFYWKAGSLTILP